MPEQQWNPASIPIPQGIWEGIYNIGGGDPYITSGLTGGYGLGQAFFAPGMLPRLDQNLSADQASALMAGRGLLDRNIPTTAAGTLQTGPYLKGQIGNIEALQKSAGQMDPYTQQVLSQMQAGLGGYTPEEMTGFREQGLEGINRQMQTAMRAAGQSALASGLRGGAAGAAMPGIARETATARAGLERDIFLQNIAEKARREQALGSLAGSTYGRLFGQQAGMAELGSNVALQRQNQMLNEIMGIGGERRADLGTFQNTLQQTRNDLLAREMYNNQQAQNELAGRLGLMFGGGGMGSALAGRLGSEALGREYLDVMRNMEYPAMDMGAFEGLFNMGGGGGYNTGAGAGTAIGGATNSWYGGGSQAATPSGSNPWANRNPGGTFWNR